MLYERQCDSPLGHTGIAFLENSEIRTMNKTLYVFVQNRAGFQAGTLKRLSPCEYV